MHSASSPCVPNSPPILSLFYRPNNIRLFTSSETYNCTAQTLIALNTQSTVSSAQFTFSLLKENFNNVLPSVPRSHRWPPCTILCNHKVTVRSCFSVCPSYITQNNLRNEPTQCTNSWLIISLLHASTCFEHYVLIIRRSKLYYTASGIITLCRWPSRAHPCTGQVWWYQMLYNTILTSWWWAHSARNM